MMNRGVWRHGELNGFMVDGLMRRVSNDDGYFVFPGGQPDQDHPARRWYQPSARARHPPQREYGRYAE